MLQTVSCQQCAFYLWYWTRVHQLFRNTRIGLSNSEISLAPVYKRRHKIDLRRSKYCKTTRSSLIKPRTEHIFRRHSLPTWNHSKSDKAKVLLPRHRSTSRRRVKSKLHRQKRKARKQSFNGTSVAVVTRRTSLTASPKTAEWVSRRPWRQLNLSKMMILACQRPIVEHSQHLNFSYKINIT